MPVAASEDLWSTGKGWESRYGRHGSVICLHERGCTSIAGFILQKTSGAYNVRTRRFRKELYYCNSSLIRAYHASFLFIRPYCRLMFGCR